MSAATQQRAKQQTQSQGSGSEHMKKAQLAVEEGRMIVPGVQALFGLQMMSAFNTRFESLSSLNQILHLSALALTTVSIALIMAPAAYNRIAEPEIGSKFFVRLASGLIAGALIPLTISITLEVYIVATLIIPSALISAAVAGFLFIVFACLWFAYPYAKRNRTRE